MVNLVSVELRVELMQEIHQIWYWNELETNLYLMLITIKDVTPYHFWSLADHYPDLVSRLHVQVRIIENFGLNAGIPWLTNTEGATYFV